ncbi:MAG: uroporphyrinogen decarboxylase family protein [Promethearchaeota archaeon]
MLPLFRKPGLTDPLLRLARRAGNLHEYIPARRRAERARNETKYAARERRVLDAISMRREPDRVPVIGNGVNFFPAKYAGITCEEFMFDHGKARAAIRKMDDFDLDMFFTYNMLAFGRIAEWTGQNLLKIPGRHIDANSGYQYNEVDRLEADEYDKLLEGGTRFLVEEIAPRTAGVFAARGLRKLRLETMALLEAARFGSFLQETSAEMRAMGHYNIFGTVATPPFDVLSFTFRTIHQLSRDLMRRKTRDKIPELMDRMAPWLAALTTTIQKVTGLPGVWFVAERAFSLSPRQFERFYWPTLKRMIVAFVRRGLVPFLTWEGDVTHLVHFLLELPKDVARRCVFNCDTTDIFEADRILDGHMCVAGNVPLSTMCVGTPRDVEKYCERLFEKLKPGGGYMLSAALGIPDEARPENVRAMIDYAKEHGEY